ncbi:Cysteine-rich membrane protein 1 [Spironucleus salmonicida]|uniref:Cysteine-rich membrane protein 1 n=1 Tax=Spironucleus salmonicida TaxID=348837 RepID=V6LSR4_9EUKA|nr:Cysteine-rich membrane protein 1 [Spironucleus salmonicida]KAH0570192.1 Cysteine-rich membrane protein 1 [Spironucleus salmonicida]|eukprot:EST47672.1 Cysteine-rich membrane protein 1 [Spironucleus salmonicida]
MHIAGFGKNAFRSVSFQYCVSGYFETRMEAADGIDCTTNKECRDGGSGYCDTTTKKCMPCAAGCKVCTSATFCAECDSKKTLGTTTITGTCTRTCSAVVNSKFCNDSVLTVCTAASTSACTCGEKTNCANCAVDSTSFSCNQCLPHMTTDSTGDCTLCEKGYEMVGILCVTAEAVPVPDPNPNPEPEPEPPIPVPPAPVPDPSDPSNKLSTGATVGIVIGALVAVGAIGGGLAFYFIRRSKK